MEKTICSECGKIPAFMEYAKCYYCMGFACKHNRDPKNPGHGGCGREAGPNGYCYKHTPTTTTRSYSSAYYDRYN